MLFVVGFIAKSVTVRRNFLAKKFMIFVYDSLFLAFSLPPTSLSTYFCHNFAIHQKFQVTSCSRDDSEWIRFDIVSPSNDHHMNDPRNFKQKLILPLCLLYVYGGENYENNLRMMTVLNRIKIHSLSWKQNRNLLQHARWAWASERWREQKVFWENFYSKFATVTRDANQIRSLN